MQTDGNSGMVTTETPPVEREGVGRFSPYSTCSVVGDVFIGS